MNHYFCTDFSVQAKFYIKGFTTTGESKSYEDLKIFTGATTIAACGGDNPHQKKDGGAGSGSL